MVDGRDGGGGGEGGAELTPYGRHGPRLR